MREIFSQGLKSRFALIFLVTPIVLAFVGPFGTYSEMSFPARLLYWSVLTIGIGTLMILCIAFVLRVRTERMTGMIPRIVFGAALAALPGAALVLVMHRVMRDVSDVVTVAGFAEVWLQVAVVGVVVSFIELARAGPYQPDAPNEPTPVPVAHIPEPVALQRVFPTEFHRRLGFDGAHAADIVSLSMQDHYVEVTCTEGNDLILMRFADAVDELEGIHGLRIHRSHWVASRHITDLRRSGHRAWVRLSDGRELPVSQTYLKDVRSFLEEPVNAL